MTDEDTHFSWVEPKDAWSIMDRVITRRRYAGIERQVGKAKNCAHPVRLAE